MPYVSNIFKHFSFPKKNTNGTQYINMNHCLVNFLQKQKNANIITILYTHKDTNSTQFYTVQI